MRQPAPDPTVPAGQVALLSRRQSGGTPVVPGGHGPAIGLDRPWINRQFGGAPTMPDGQVWTLRQLG
jgi:hypothetical protein